MSSNNLKVSNFLAAWIFMENITSLLWYFVIFLLANINNNNKIKLYYLFKNIYTNHYLF